MAHEPIPLARPVLGEAEERAVIEVLRSGPALARARALGAFEQRVRGARRRALASAVSSGTAGPAPGAARGRACEDGDEVVTSPFSFVASANAAVFERARPVFADIDPVTLNLDPAAAAAAVTERTRALLPVHIFGYPADMAAFEALAARARPRRSSRTPARRSGRVHARRHARSAPRGNPAVFGFYANKQLTTGEGGMVTLGDAEMKERIDSERNQGRAPDMGWLDHDRLGFNYRLSDIACALGLAQLERLEEMLAGRAPRGGALPRGARGHRGAGAAVRGPRRQTRRGWFVFVVQLPRGADRDEAVRALAAARHPEQAVPAGDPPDELLPRALRPPRGRVPGLRGRRRALARAAVLPGDERGPGRARGGRAARGRSAGGRPAVRTTLRPCRASTSPRTPTSSG